MKFTLSLVLFVTLLCGYVSAQNSPLNREQGDELPDLKGDLNQKNRIEIYPNPSTDYLTVTIANSDLKSVEFELYNIIGNKQKLNVEEISGNRYKLNVKDYTQGYYLIIVKDPITKFSEAFKFQKK